MLPAVFMHILINLYLIAIEYDFPLRMYRLQHTLLCWVIQSWVKITQGLCEFLFQI